MSQVTRKRVIIESDSEEEKDDKTQNTEFKPLYESHIIQETPDLKPGKRKRITNYAELNSSPLSGINSTSNNLDSSIGSDDDFNPDGNKKVEPNTKSWKPKKQPKKLFNFNGNQSDDDGDELGILTGASNGKDTHGSRGDVPSDSESKIDRLKTRVPGYDEDFYNDVLNNCDGDVIKAERNIRQMMATGKASPKKSSSSSPEKIEPGFKLKSKSAALRPPSANGFTPVLAKPDKEFIGDNNKKSLVAKAELLSDSDDDVQAIPGPSNGRVKLPTFGAKGPQSFYFSNKSVLKAEPVKEKQPFVRKEPKVKQKRRFMTKGTTRDDVDTYQEDSNDSFINDDDSEIEEILSGDEEEEKIDTKKKKKQKSSKTKKSLEKDELLDLVDSDDGSDADIDEDRIILTSDDDFDEDDIDDEEDKPRKKKSQKKKEKQSTLKERVFNFMETASLCDLLSIPGVSKKKAEVLISLRPFANYTDFVLKVRSTKGLNTEIINSSLSAIKSRDVVHKLMAECESISSSIVSMVSELKEAKQPKVLNKECKLKQYQMIGLNWLVLMHKKGINAILADEMGLGKTIQVIALLAHLREHFNLNGPHCIVVPASTLDNWDREMSTWCPDIDVLVYHGSQAERTELREKIFNNSMNFDVILTTYNMLFSDDDKKLFKRKNFEYIIFDEAHMLKNMKTARYEKLLKLQAKHRLLLTGTPLQNNLLELMSLLIFTMPDLFQGRTDHVKNMFTYSSVTSGSSESDKSNYEQERINHAKKIMKPFILRRLKDDVLKQLPTKTVIVKKCPMSAAQEKKYKKMIASYQDEIRKDDSIIEDIDITDTEEVTEVHDRVGGLEGSPKKSGSKNKEAKVSKVVADDEDDEIKRRKAGAAMLMNLRKAANHPLLNRIHYNSSKLRQMSKLMLKEPTHRDANPDFIYEDMELHTDFELHQLCLKYPSLNTFKLNDIMIIDSGKFKFLDELLPTMKKEKRKVLIFSQFVMVLDIIEAYLNIRKHRFTRLDGSTKITDRLDLIDDFNDPESDHFIFLLTTKAGGVGINLTAATVAVIHDIDFNPYNDKQAEDRCHRVGQTKEVTVYKLISSNSIEEGMLAIADNKLKLGADLCGTNEQKKNQETNKKDMKTLLKQVLNL